MCCENAEKVEKICGKERARNFSVIAGSEVGCTAIGGMIGAAAKNLVGGVIGGAAAGAVLAAVMLGLIYREEIKNAYSSCSFWNVEKTNNDIEKGNPDKEKYTPASPLVPSRQM